MYGKEVSKSSLGRTEGITRGNSQEIQHSTVQTQCIIVVPSRKLGQAERLREGYLNLKKKKKKNKKPKKKNKNKKPKTETTHTHKQTLETYRLQLLDRFLMLVSIGCIKQVRPITY